MAIPQQKPPPMTVPSKIIIRKMRGAQEDIEVYAEVLQDGVSNDKTVRGQTTFHLEGALVDGKGGKFFYRTPGYSWENKGGLEIVTKLNGLAEIKGIVKIQTVYGLSANRAERSGYGRGTTPEDERAGNTSLGFHESCHRDNFLNYLKSRSLPSFGGRVGMTRQQYEQAAAAFGKAIDKYFAEMEHDSARRTDEVGYLKTMYDAKGPRP